MFNNIYRQKIKRQKIALKSRKKRIKELEDKVSMLEFFYDGNGFTKRGLHTAIQIAKYIETLESYIDVLEEEIKKWKEDYICLENLKDNQIKELKEQTEKTKNCGNCKNYAEPYGLCCYSLGDEDYDCHGRKWELAE